MTMKKIIILILICTVKNLNAQNVGIGTTTPAFKLDVKNGSINTDSLYRIGGNRVLAVSGNGVNIFLGIQSGTGSINNNVSANTGLGYYTLFSNTGGHYNTATGIFALRDNISGSYNTAHGSYSLQSNVSGDHNTATGLNALNSNTSGIYNTATGSGTLRYNTTGYYNTANGTNALYNNTTGLHNTADGFYALNFNTTGNYNTAVGALALNATTTAWYNTAIGHEAGKGFNLGYNNTLIGAGANVSFNSQYNSIAIGLGANCPDNSTVRIGNSANWSYGGYANWTNISDERFKKNIKENVKGLDFIMKLKPVTYQLNVAELSKKLNEFSNSRPNESMKKAMAEKEQMWWTGFLAQDVEAAAKQSGFEFSGVDKPRNADGLYGLRYAEFVVPLVKAVQEQQQQITDMQKRIKLLEEQNIVLLQLLKNKN
jgi:trimeric autotransporter adhesin